MSSKTYTSTLRKQSSATDPQIPSVGALRVSKWGKDKPTYESNLVCFRSVVHQYEITLDWPQAYRMLEVAGVPIPSYMGDYRSAVEKLGSRLRFWAHTNLKIGLEFNVFGTHFDPRIQLFFQTKSDMVKWKLAWYNL